MLKWAGVFEPAAHTWPDLGLNKQPAEPKLWRMDSWVTAQATQFQPYLIPDPKVVPNFPLAKPLTDLQKKQLNNVTLLVCILLLLLFFFLRGDKNDIVNCRYHV